MTETVGSISTGYPVDEVRRADDRLRSAERIARETAAGEREREAAARKAAEALESDQTISTIV